MQCNLNSVINMIDDEFVEECLKVQTREQMKEICKTNKKRRIFTFGGLSVCTAVLAVALVLIVVPKGSNAKTGSAEKISFAYNQIVNPIHTVNDGETINDYVSYSVPFLDKEIDSQCYISSDVSSEQGVVEINYKDGSSFRMSNDIYRDISGYYGATKMETIIIASIEVDLYKYENTAIAMWNDGTFSYVYTVDGEMSKVEIQDLICYNK